MFQVLVYVFIKGVPENDRVWVWSDEPECQDLSFQSLRCWILRGENIIKGICHDFGEKDGKCFKEEYHKLKYWNKRQQSKLRNIKIIYLPKMNDFSLLNIIQILSLIWQPSNVCCQRNIDHFFDQELSKYMFKKLIHIKTC